MAKKIRKKTLSLESYLEEIVEEDISDNQDVQRLFCWENGMINELIKTVLTNIREKRKMKTIKSVKMNMEKLFGNLLNMI